MEKEKSSVSVSSSEHNCGCNSVNSYFKRRLDYLERAFLGWLRAQNSTIFPRYFLRIRSYNKNFKLNDDFSEVIVNLDDFELHSQDVERHVCSVLKGGSSCLI